MAGYRGEGYGIYGDHGDDDYLDDIRSERERGPEGRDRERDEDRFMFGGRQESGWGSEDRDDDRGFFDRARDETRSWFSGSDDDDRRAGSDRTAEDYRRRYGMQGHEGQYGRGMRDEGSRGGMGHPFSGSSQDEHYRSWRDRQMQELDRDYRDYCREREQQFHQDFDSWRSNRSRQGEGQGQDQQGFPGTGSSRQTSSSESTLTLDTPADSNPAAQKGETTMSGGSPSRPARTRT